MSIYLFLCLSIYLCLSVDLSVCQSIYVCLLMLYVDLFIYLSSVCRFIYVCLSVDPFIYLSVAASIYICLLIYLFICLSARLSRRGGGERPSKERKFSYYDFEEVPDVDPGVPLRGPQPEALQEGAVRGVQLRDPVEHGGEVVGRDDRLRGRQRRLQRLHVLRQKHFHLASYIRTCN